ncbi:DUF551 domain-containing protein [Escherichia coli]|nr:DUF551 domain-containing protein [Escherichia coli]EFN4765848.1 DUF551 domain-containing protein [Escherichia coli]EKG2421369.1 DUF551 domain-containing protein [Escherichia coli]EKG4690709.1 DUF551 domain-containing protein [Escherichia coli]EKY9438943.1 DUF551 domain-containing protein [Escherichia coli]
MSAITKERIKLFIKNPLDNGLTRGEQMELARIALASLEAEPIGFRCRRNDNLGDWSYVYHREPDDFERKHLVIEGIYAAPPAPVVPEEATPENVEMLSGYVSTYKLTDSERDIAAEIWNACRAAMLQSGNFRENKNSSTNNFREIAETSTNYPAIPSEVLSAILKVARIRADFDDFDGDRRGIGDCLDEAEQELIVTINKYASQLAAEPIAANDVREQQTAVPPVPEIQADVAQAIENLKQKLVECNRYNYCADAVKGVEDACRAVSYSQADNQPASGNQAAESNRDNEWTGNPDIDNAIIMLDRIDTLENCDDDRIEAVKAVLRRLAGNSPVIPDGWISCSERMPEDTKMLLAFSQGEIVAAYWNWVVNPIDYKKYRAFTYLSGNILDDVTHWMPLPEPPQEVK